MDKLKESLLDIWDDTLDFFDDHKISIIISIVAIIVVLTTAITTFLILRPVVITICDAETKSVVSVTRNNKIKVVAISKKGNKEIKSDYDWSVEGGTLSNDPIDGSLTWYLPVESGTYSITATSDKATTTQTVTVIESELVNIFRTNGYNILLQDTDGDGLTDIYETTYSKTSTTSYDTDGDGISDGDEVFLELNPNKVSSKDDDIKDGNRRLEYKTRFNNVEIKVVGTGNVTKTSIDKYSAETIENSSAILDGIYAGYSYANLESAELVFTYSDSNVQYKGLDENSLAVYELDDVNNSFNKVSTSTINTANNTITISTEKLGKYFIADTSKLTSYISTDIVFLIDNSASMYSAEEVAGSEENDVYFDRVKVIDRLIERLNGNYKFGAGKFTFDYTELVSLSSDKQAVVNRINTIVTETERNFNGTNIGAAIEGGLKQFNNSSDQNRKYIIVISDGEDTANAGEYNKGLLKEQLEYAEQIGAKIYTVGLGNSINAENLKQIAEATGGKYYFASTADDLYQMFSLIEADLSYGLYDTDYDDVNDSIILYNSNFDVSRNGFPFSNFSNTEELNGFGYGMALYTKLFFEEDTGYTLSEKKVTDNNGKEVSAPSVKVSDLNKSIISTLRTYEPVSDSFKILCSFPNDFWTMSGKIRNTYATILSKSGFKLVNVKNTIANSPVTSYQAIQLDMEKINSKDSALGDDTTAINVFSRLDITKYRDTKYNFYENNDDTFAMLIYQIYSGKPTLLIINDTYTVLATKILVDIYNMNEYKIEVYDPNYSGVRKYINVTRNKFEDIDEISDVVSDKYEYRFNYLGTDVGVYLSFPNIAESL